MAARNIALPDGATITVRLHDGRELHVKVNPGGGGTLAYDATQSGQVILTFTAMKGCSSWST